MRLRMPLLVPDTAALTREQRDISNLPAPSHPQRRKKGISAFFQNALDQRLRSGLFENVQLARVLLEYFGKTESLNCPFSRVVWGLNSNMRGPSLRITLLVAT